MPGRASRTTSAQPAGQQSGKQTSLTSFFGSPRTESISGKSDDTAVTATNFNKSAVSPPPDKPKSSELSTGSSAWSKKENNGPDSVGEMTAMAQRLMIDKGEPVTAEERRRAMRMRVQVAVPTRPQLKRTISATALIAETTIKSSAVKQNGVLTPTLTVELNSGLQSDAGDPLEDEITVSQVERPKTNGRNVEQETGTLEHGGTAAQNDKPAAPKAGLEPAPVLTSFTPVNQLTKTESDASSDVVMDAAIADSIEAQNQAENEQSHHGLPTTAGLSTPGRSTPLPTTDLAALTGSPQKEKRPAGSTPATPLSRLAKAKLTPGTQPRQLSLKETLFWIQTAEKPPSVIDSIPSPNRSSGIPQLATSSPFDSEADILSASTSGPMSALDGRKRRRSRRPMISTPDMIPIPIRADSGSESDAIVSIRGKRRRAAVVDDDSDEADYEPAPSDSESESGMSGKDEILLDSSEGEGEVVPEDEIEQERPVRASIRGRGGSGRSGRGIGRVSRTGAVRRASPEDGTRKSCRRGFVGDGDDNDDDEAFRAAFLTADIDSDEATQYNGGTFVDSDDDQAMELAAKIKAKAKKMEPVAESHGIIGIASNKGPDFGLPPLTSIESIFDDMVSRAASFGGGESSLMKAAAGLAGMGLRVATMCSGTESPLLALGLINSSLKTAGLPGLNIAHRFSAEIEPFKQAYIDRNFRVPLLFRDVVEMALGGCTKATTAYGALADIPKDVDLLVVGFSCVDYSNLNNYKKSMEEMGQSGATFKAVLTFAREQQPSMIVVENVDGAEWDKIGKCFSDVGYSSQHAKVDTKAYYLPQTRCRGYMVCLRRDVYGAAAADKLAAQWARLMEQLKRRTSAPFRDFVLPDDDHRIVKARWERADATGNTILWEACQGRHEAERVAERLGRKRELLRWVDGGSCVAPEYGDRAWLGRMPERVWDLLELLNLKSALRHGFDFQFKSQLFDLSQNPDRINQVCPAGLSGCITPRGMLYVADKGRCLTGYEMLSLQGIPIDRISLSHETDDELRDLAGNAMTSTVVGVALISALMVGWKGLISGKPRDDSDLENVGETAEEAAVSLAGTLTANKFTDQMTPVPLPDVVTGTWPGFSTADVSAMLAEAALSSRMCFCESADAWAADPIQQCRLCTHRSCTQCGRRPVHEYAVWHGRRVPADQWRRRWSRRWPIRFQIEVAASSIPVGEGTIGARYAEVLKKAVDEAVSLVRFRRGPVWQVEYESDSARMVIRLDGAASLIELFAKPDRTWAASDPVRRLVEGGPVGRARFPVGMTVGGGDAGWQFFEPGRFPSPVSISAVSTGGTHPTARARMGLADYVSETQPAELNVESTKFDVSVAEAADKISGRYKLLPECGTAFSSLYTRVGEASDRPMMLLLDSSPLGSGENDRFVFSREPGRVEYGNIRPVVVGLSRAWRPWAAIGSSSGSGPTEWQWETKTEWAGRFVAAPSVVRLPSVPVAVSIGSGDEVVLRPTSVTTVESGADPECGQVTALAALSLSIPAQKETRSIALADASVASQFGWAFVAVRSAVGAQLGRWHTIQPRSSDGLGSINWQLWHIPGHDDNAMDAPAVCLGCAPPRPTVKWLPKPGRGLAKTALKGLKAGKGTSAAAAAAAGTGGPLIASEDAREAGVYEAQVKAQPDKLNLFIQSDEKGTVATVAAGVRMMAHQAAGRLVGDTLRLALCHGTVDLGSVAAAWRVETDHSAGVGSGQPRLTIGSNAEDEAVPTPAGFRMPLRLDQRRSLNWMKTQERGVPFSVFDADEACAAPVGWRVEVRASANVTVRGGVIADQVSYGKTVTTLALVAGDAEVDKGGDVLPESTTLPTLPGRLRCRATVVVCPRHLTGQWRTEARKFLPGSPFDIDGSVLEIPSASALLGVSGRQVADARLVIVAWDALVHDAHVDALEKLSGAPLPVRTGRAFADFCASVGDMLGPVLTEAGRDAILRSGVAVKTGRGKAPPGKAWDGSLNGRLPTVLQMFHFRRLIVDEFSYLLDPKGPKPGLAAMIGSLGADCRWLLSGTPPLGGFGDVDRMARLLGFGLGAALPTPAELKSAGRDQYSKTEIFAAFRQSRSAAWHAARLGLAARFLEKFVRQNEARLDDPIDGVSCVNYAVPVQLGPVHRAVYVELAQHVNGVDMKIRRANDSSDRAGRLNRSLAGCSSAEEALLNCAAAFDPTVSLSGVVEARKSARAEICAEVAKQVTVAAGMKRALGSEDTHYASWCKAVSNNSAGDASVTSWFLRLFKALDKRGSKSKVGKDGIRQLRDLVVGLRVLTKELTMRVRSLRFLGNVRLLAEKAVGDSLPNGDAESESGSGSQDKVKQVSKQGFDDPTILTCSNPTCTEKADKKDLRILAFCGHVLCPACQDGRVDMEACPVRSCGAHSSESAVVTYADLAADNSDLYSNVSAPAASFGAKLDHVASLLLALPADERALLFVPNDPMALVARRMCQEYSIGYAVIDSSDSVASSSAGATSVSVSQAISSFISDRAGYKVLILNQASEAAAGTNLVRANHVIFLSPTLATSQHEYDSRMRQAIGRARRYGQTRPVTVYLYAAVRTVDVDVWEMRERRGIVLHQLPRPASSANSQAGDDGVGQMKGVLGALPGKLTGFVRSGVRRAHYAEYFPPEMAATAEWSARPVEDLARAGESEDGDCEMGSTAEAVVVMKETGGELPAVEPVRMARVRWRGRDEIVLAPRGLLDGGLDGADGVEAVDRMEVEDDENEVVDDGDDDMNDSLEQAVRKSNTVVPVGSDKFVSLIRFSAAFQGV